MQDIYLKDKETQGNKNWNISLTAWHKLLKIGQKTMLYIAHTCWCSKLLNHLSYRVTLVNC